MILTKAMKAKGEGCICSYSGLHYMNCDSFSQFHMLQTNEIMVSCYVQESEVSHA